jgi:glycosyltransferase involved in cell wall biosynthesis
VQATLNTRVEAWKQLIFDRRPRYAHIYPLDDLRSNLRSVLKRVVPDIVHLDMLFTAPLSQEISNIPWILGQHNEESRTMRRWAEDQKRWIRRKTAALDSLKLSRWEEEWIRRSDACIAVSEEDAKSFRTMSSKSQVFVVENGVDAADFSPPSNVSREQSRLLFLGTLEYGPNQEAITTFCKQIFPLISKERPDVRLQILGRGAPQRVVNLGQIPNVDFVGFVDDVRPYLWSASASIVPIQTGGGTRFKILESLAAGCPVVSTNLGAEGLELLDGIHCYIADDAELFAQRVLELIDNPEIAGSLAKNGQEFVINKYDWASVAPKLEIAYMSALEG